MKALVNILLFMIAGTGSALVADTTLSIASYNVENLFDTEHDEGKEDFTFTPVGTPGKAEYCATLTNEKYKRECEVDWNEKRYNAKLKSLANAIKLLPHGIPDFLALSEIENRRTVEDLAQQVGYKLVQTKKTAIAKNVLVTNSPDQRGIDVALIFKPSKNIELVGEMKEHVINVGKVKSKPTRNILEAKFKIFDQYHLYIYVVHWPSQGGGSIAEKARMLAGEKVQELISAAKQEDSKNHIIVLGDFNVLESDHPHAIYDQLMNSVQGVKLFDVHDGFFKNQLIDKNLKRMLPFGTYFYPVDMSWSRFDRILVSDNLEAGYIKKCQKELAILTESYGIHAHSKLMEDYFYEDPAEEPTALMTLHQGSLIKNVPAHSRVLLENDKKQGYSDHFAIYAQLWDANKDINIEECRNGQEYGYTNDK